MEPLDGSGYLSSRLTTFNFNGYEELEHEVEFIKYILKEAIVLNSITIKVSAQFYPPKKKKVSAQHSMESVLKKLSMFPSLFCYHLELTNNYHLYMINGLIITYIIIGLGTLIIS